MDKFIDYFWNTPELYNNVQRLKGKRLACWCAPDEPCHAAFLCDLANRRTKEEVTAAGRGDGGDPLVGYAYASPAGTDMSVNKQ